MKTKYLSLTGIMLGLFLINAPVAQAKLGQLDIKSFPAAFLLIDGQSIAPKPLKKIKVGVEPGKHVLTSYAPGYMEEDWDIKIRPGKLTSINVVLVKAGQNREEMISVSGGAFDMGVDAKRAAWMVKRLKTAGKHFADHQPKHEVNVKPFKIDMHEVTNRQYAQFIRATKRKPPKHWKYGDFRKNEGDYPVVNVSWHDAAAYAKWAKKRLPTEAEWEMAARDAGKLIFPWGQVFRQDKANVEGSGFNSACITGRYYKGRSKNDGYDFSGNVAEWTATWYDVYPGATLNDPVAGKKTHRVIRGGSWKSKPYQSTAVARDKLPPDSTVNYVGFRCVK